MQLFEHIFRDIGGLAASDFVIQVTEHDLHNFKKICLAIRPLKAVAHLRQRHIEQLGIKSRAIRHFYIFAIVVLNRITVL